MKLFLNEHRLLIKKFEKFENNANNVNIIFYLFRDDRFSSTF